MPYPTMRDKLVVRKREKIRILCENCSFLFNIIEESFCSQWSLERIGDVGDGTNQIFLRQRCPLYFVHHFFSDFRIAAITSFAGST